MRINKITKCVFSALLILFSQIALGQGYCAEKTGKYTLKFATIAPEGSTWMNIMAKMNSEIQEKTGGKLKIRFYPGGIMGDELDVLRKMRINQIHGGGFTGVGLGEIAPEVRALDLPFLFKDNNEVDYVHEKLFDKFAKDFDAKGYILMGWAEVGFVNIFSKSPVDNMDKLKKVKLWVWQDDPIAKGTFESMGVPTVPLPITDVLTSLQVGIIDTVYTPPLGALATQWYSKVKYMFSYPVTHSTGAVLVSKSFFGKLPPDFQAVLKEQFAKHLLDLNKSTREDNLKSIETLKKNGIQVLEPSEQAINEFQGLSSPSREKFVGKFYSKELLDEINKLIQTRKNGKQ